MPKGVGLIGGMAARRASTLSWVTSSVVRRGASLLLVVATVLLAVPFICLVSASVMWPREESQQTRFGLGPFRLPYHVTRTPYVADRETRSFDRPTGMSEETWSALRQLIEPVLWDAAQPLLATREVPDAVRNELREHLTRHLWESIVRDMPARLWQAPPNRIRAAVDAEVTASRVEDAWGFLYRSVRLRSPIVEMADRVESAAPGARWSVVRGGVQLVSAMDEGEAATELWAAYDTDRGAPVAGYVASEFPLAVAPTLVRSIVLRVRGDESYHELTPVLELGGNTYRASRSIVLDRFAWEDVRLVLPGWRAGERDVALAADSDAADARMMRTGRVTLVLRPAPYATAVLRKLSRNWVAAWTGMGFPRALWNTTVVAFVGTVVQLVTCLPAGYAFARYRWFGRRAMFHIVLLTMAVPAQATMIPVFLSLRALGMYGSLHGLWIRWACGTGVGLYLAARCFARIDRDEERAATLDGCGAFRAFWYTALPVARPVVVAVAVVQLVVAWRDFAWPATVLTDERRQLLTTALWGLHVSDGSSIGVQMAAVMLVSAPVLAVLFLARRDLARAVQIALGAGTRETMA